MQKNVIDEFSRKLAARVSALKLGKGIDTTTTNGPLVNAVAVKKVNSQVRDAISKGGKLLIGGSAPDRPGFFYEPTVITNATKDMDFATDETFGPLAAVYPFDTEEDVIQLANDTDYGLAGYFYTRNLSRAMRVSQAMECGMFGVNTGLMTAAEAPFGGIKESGVGIEGSRYGIAEYQNIKGITFGNLDN